MSDPTPNIVGPLVFGDAAQIAELRRCEREAERVEVACDCCDGEGTIICPDCEGSGEKPQKVTTL